LQLGIGLGYGIDVDRAFWPEKSLETTIGFEPELTTNGQGPNPDLAKKAKGNQINSIQIKSLIALGFDQSLGNQVGRRIPNKTTIQTGSSSESVNGSICTL